MACHKNSWCQLHRNRKPPPIANDLARVAESLYLICAGCIQALGLFRNCWCPHTLPTTRYASRRSDQENVVDDSSHTAITCQPIRILRLITMSTLLLCAPLGYAFAFAGYRLARSFTPGFVCGGVLALACLVSFVATAVWPCPHCHKRFVRLNAFWPRRCSHCGFVC